MPEPIEISFTVNGRPVAVRTDPDRTALDVLREDLGQITLKAGCSPQGVCGACAAIVDGRSRVTCTMSARSLDGRTVLTHDGIDPEEAAIYAEAFSRTGATQCGFCTPGIVMATKALLDRDPEPDRNAVDKALGMHVCRCTGWVKVFDAIDLAARMRRGEAAPGDPDPGLGGDWRPEAVRAAVLGRRPFIQDMTRPGMLHGALAWTPHARCRVVRVDTSEAERVPGVRAVITARDLPADRRVGLIFRDWPVMIAEGEETACAADVLAAVAADTPEAARAGAAAVKVEVEPLPPVTDVEEAARDPERVIATSRVVRGDAERALAEAAHVVEETFRTQRVEQAFLEPEAALVVPDGEGGFTVYSCGQGVFDDRRQLATLFGLPEERLRVVLVPTGGGFGGKEDLNVQPHALALAMRTGRPVRIVLRMEESLRFHPKRHPMVLRYRVGCDAEGRLVAVHARILGDTGGYASVGDKVLERAAGHACGPYRVPNVDVEARTVKTNNPVAGAMRGFGVNQAAFALEGCLDRLAEKLGMDPFEFRLRNVLRPGDAFATGQVMNEGCAIEATLEALRPHYERARAAGKHVGVACGIKNVGMGNGLVEAGRIELEVRSPDEIVLHTGFTEMGQGHDTVVAQMVAAEAGLSPDLFHVECSTRADVDVGMTTASRATYLAGNAARLAGRALREALDAAGGELARLVGRRFRGEWTAPATHSPEQGAELLARGEAPVTHYAFGFAAQLAILDEQGRLEEIVAAHDVGRVIHRPAAEGQVEGGVAMGIGFALSEELRVGDDGMPDTRYGRLGIVKARHMPKVTTLLVEHPDPAGPWGAKGLGEIGLVPTAPAIAAALRSFEGRWRTELPMRDSAAARSVGAPRR